MNVIDQNTALASLDRNLLPGKSLIDGRTVRERLLFLSQLGTLINFYDENNRIYGNWEPFLLKDPVFLLASISLTPFERWNALYQNTCRKVQNEMPLTMESTDLGPSFDELYEQFIKVFTRIGRWTYYMQKTEDAYALKSYVLHKVETIFSQYLWALVSFKETLYSSRLIKGITPVHPGALELFNDKLWTLNKNRVPFWEVLGLNEDFELNTAGDFFHALQSAGDKLFSFFHTIIEHAGPEYDQLSIQQSKYPDTTLLRTFISLLQIQQDQLNELSGRHLEFYYHSILKQGKLLAVPDHVIICAELAKKDAAFVLPAGTLFNAGLDADKNPVEYASVEKAVLNPAAVTSAYTLSCLPEKGTLGMLSSLYFQAIPDPGIVRKEENGTMRQWETFGGSTPPPETQIKLGMTFASPLLLLREGLREITLALSFERPGAFSLLKNAAYFLSTATAWLPVKASVLPDTSLDGGKNKVYIMMNVDETQPAVEKFLADPDGLDSAWPMLKVEFSFFSDMAHPPVLTDLEIEVTVTGLKNLQLYNDNGLLDAKTPFQPFGPLPLLGSSFIIGSNEIFSKPFDCVFIALSWDALPPDFALYYAQYNAYINEYDLWQPDVRDPKDKVNGQESVQAPATKAQEEKKPSLLKRFTSWLGGLVRSKPANTATEPETKKKDKDCIPEYFNNLCFRTGFRLLENQQWSDFPMQAEDPFVPLPPVDSVKKGKVTVQEEKQEQYLFCVRADNTLLNMSFFDYTSSATESADPYIQNTPLVFTDESASGFMKMVLTAPGYGFGSELYAGLVSDIAFKNAVRLINADKPPQGEERTKKEKKEKDDVIIAPAFLQPAALPFVPKLKGISANYSAKQRYDLTRDRGDYPLQCFFHSPFENYCIYDNTPGAPGLQNSAGLTITGIVWERSGLPLFPQLDYSGVLFLELENLVPADSLSLFFELSRKYADSEGSRDISYNYLSTVGWKPLNVLADDTNNFTCSGVIKVSIPLDMASDSLIFPEKKNWISIGIKNDPGSFAETVYLKTNGFKVQRSGLNFLPVTEKPWIPANTIVQAKLPLPQIAAIEQPFPSEGGRAAETETVMNRRVSNRLKTKDRVVTAEDYFRLIRQEFDDIYYSKVLYDVRTRKTEIYVVKAYDSAKDPNAFLPLVSECSEGKIETFLRERASSFANINVSNFRVEYVKVKAVVMIRDGYEDDGVRKNIINAINIYLSPWIVSRQPQIAIDQGISDADLAAVIKSVGGVIAVEQVSFSTRMMDDKENIFFTSPVGQQGRVIRPELPSALFVPYPTHDINFN